MNYDLFGLPLANVQGAADFKARQARRLAAGPVLAAPRRRPVDRVGWQRRKNSPAVAAARALIRREQMGRERQ